MSDLVPRDATLARLSKARALVEAADTVADAKGLRDRAEALRVYAARSGESLAVQNACAEVRLQAERKAGQLLAETPLDSGGRPGKNRSHDATGFHLADLGVSKSQSSRWQGMARVPDDAWAEHTDPVRATEEGRELTTAGIVRLARALDERDIADLPKPAPPEGCYRTVVIDPPWPMAKISRQVRPLQPDVLDYPVQTLDQIAELPVPDLIDPAGAHVYLWVTHRFMPAGLDLLNGWGCRYECQMTWVKPVGITPYSWMYDTEHVLFARAGKRLDLERKGLRLSFQAPAAGHSVKPDEFYQRVEQASPGPRIDLYARRPRAGWATWGNQIAA